MNENLITKHENAGKRLSKGAAVAFGFFDGLHLGHQRLMRRLFEICEKNAYTSVVYTFSNHPFSVLGKGHPPMLFTPEEKWQALRAFGAEHVCMVPFTKALSQTEYDHFVRNLMLTIPIRDIVIGFNYRMGKNGQGTPEKITALGNELGFSVHVVQPVLYKDAAISSTRIRECIQAGNLKDARQMLGRPYAVYGMIDKGYRLGSRLGFPTANIAYTPDKAIVPNGVYVTEAVMDGKTYAAVTNVGSRPTVSALGQITIETHLLDFHGDIYGKAMEVRFLDKLREEQAFASIDELCAQIRLDIEKAEKIYASGNGC
ncbi:MAG: bifunctional riboflavin kinase/FAD synthetase [Bacillota bacterium]